VYIVGEYLSKNENCLHFILEKTENTHYIKVFLSFAGFLSFWLSLDEFVSDRKGCL
jgi:hypothetical protein